MSALVASAVPLESKTIVERDQSALQMDSLCSLQATAEANNLTALAAAFEIYNKEMEGVSLIPLRLVSTKIVTTKIVTTKIVGSWSGGAKRIERRGQADRFWLTGLQAGQRIRHRS